MTEVSWLSGSLSLVYFIIHQAKPLNHLFVRLKFNSVLICQTNQTFPAQALSLGFITIAELSPVPGSMNSDDSRTSNLANEHLQGSKAQEEF